MKRHIESARAKLGELHALSSKTEAAERKILDCALKRHEFVVAALGRAHTGVEGAGDAAQDRYLNLVTERGHLEIVIAKAREILGK